MAALKPFEADSMTVTSIPYLPDPSHLFDRLRQRLSDAVWLDSAGGGAGNRRYDIISAEPRITFTCRGSETLIKAKDQPARVSRENPFNLVQEYVSAGPAVTDQTLPFTGGAMGYFGYHLNERLERLPPAPRRYLNLPDMHVGIYDWALIFDHLQQRGSALFLPAVAAQFKREIESIWQQNQSDAGPLNSFKINKIESIFNKNSYLKKLASIKTYISDGDVYQVNLAQGFKASYTGDTFSAYRHLRRLLPSPYSAYLQYQQGAILSFSPELFLQVEDKQVLTQPIKGTRARDSDTVRDQQIQNELKESGKDRAENLMIVDLLRNDLGKHCIPGTIQVPRLFELQSFANVHHLVSSVTGTLRPGSRPLDLLRDCFPGGSITGAPKIRAMEIISELEQLDRSLYCGSVGYLSYNGKLSTNIAIRTVVADRDTIYAWGGGGIVAESDPGTEYEECLDKINILLEGLRSL